MNLSIMHYVIFYYFLVLFAVHLQPSRQQVNDLPVLNYYLSEADTIVNVDSLTDTNSDKCVLISGLLSCMSTKSRLSDNITVEGEQFDDTRFVIWEGDFSLGFGFQDAFIARVDIYFYNNPTQDYGIPPLLENGRYTFGSLMFDSEGIPISVAYVNNSHLTQTDNQTTMVSVIVNSDYDDNEYTRLRLSFITSSTPFNKTAISEVRVYEGFADNRPVYTFPLIQLQVQMVQTVDTVISTVDLSCTVINEGSFNITWTTPNGQTISNGGNAHTKLLSADASRTSILRINRVSLMDNGTYTCNASYTFFEAPSEPLGANITTLILQGSVLHTDTVHASVGDDSISLQCNFTGYLPSITNVIWRDSNGNLLEFDEESKYNISISMDGPGISNIEGVIMDNGVTSTLTIFSVMETDLNMNYTCEIENSNINIGIIQLSERSTPVPTTSDLKTNTIVPSQSTTQTTQATSTDVISISQSSVSSSSTSTSLPSTSIPVTTASTSNLIPIIGGSVIGIILLAIVLVIVLVIVFVLLRKKKVHESQAYYDESDPMYTEVLKPALPPIPDQFYSTGYAEITLPEDSRDNIPLKEFSPTHSNVQPTKLSSRPDFLQKNPTYTSSEDVTKAPPTMLKSGSLPFLDRTEETDYNLINSSFNIYAETGKAPSIPSYHGTPEPCGIYNEDINPSVFRTALNNDGDDDIYQLYRSVYFSPQPLQRSETLIEVKEKNIRKLKDLGMGQFGEVELAHTVGLSLKKLRMSESNNDPGVSLVVAVKRLKSDADKTMREAFENEIKFMARLNHENVIRLLGVCLSDNAFIMMEYMEEGDLNSYLKGLKFVTVDSYPLPEGTVDVAVLVYICLQVAAGMKYLAGLRYIHRDLATRNVLVGQDFKIKIADFGMSQQLYSSYYYRIKGKAILPIRWMANECFYGRFSEKTDVWSYGILMWEVFTLCHMQPYENFTDQELIDDAIKGTDRTLMSQPDTCPEEVYHVMLRCWVNDPDTRANFEEIHGLLLQIHAYNQNV